MIGHEVGYGRTRGTGAVGEYTVVFDHIHEGVGRRAATLALAIVQDAFAGTLNGSEHAVGELRAIAATPALAQPHRHVLCGITGGIGRTETHVALTTLGIGNRTDDAALVDIPPLDLLQMGLPYTSSDIAIILDAAPIDVPERYRDSDRAARLMSIVADGVQQNGIVLCPDNAPHIHDWVRRAHRRIVTFHSDDDILVRAQRAARVAADTLKASMNEPAKMDVNAR
jgi:hypothetical protein